MVRLRLRGLGCAPALALLHCVVTRCVYALKLTLLTSRSRANTFALKLLVIFTQAHLERTVARAHNAGSPCELVTRFAAALFCCARARALCRLHCCAYAFELSVSRSAVALAFLRL